MLRPIVRLIWRLIARRGLWQMVRLTVRLILWPMVWLIFRPTVSPKVQGVGWFVEFLPAESIERELQPINRASCNGLFIEIFVRGSAAWSGGQWDFS